MIYITGDKHGDFSEVYAFCCKNKTIRDDLMIVLGDAGINYYANEQDMYLKNSLLQYPMTFFCIHGNHEERPITLVISPPAAATACIVFCISGAICASIISW